MSEPQLDDLRREIEPRVTVPNFDSLVRRGNARRRRHRLGAATAAAVVVAAIAGGASQLDRISADPQPAQLPQHRVGPEEVADARAAVRRASSGGAVVHVVPVSAQNLIVEYLRVCPNGPCATPYVATGDRWASEHYGLLGQDGVGGLRLVPLDDRLVYVSSASAAWVVDTETGRRERLDRRKDPVTIELSSDRYVSGFDQQPPQVVDLESWSIAPLELPDDALTTSQAPVRAPSGRLWAVRQDGGLMLTDDGGETWNDVDGPPGIRTKQVRLAVTDDRLAVLDQRKGDILVSDDQGSSWRTLDVPRRGARMVFALTDGNLVLGGSDGTYVTTSTEWAALREVPAFDYVTENGAAVRHRAQDGTRATSTPRVEVLRDVDEGWSALDLPR